MARACPPSRRGRSCRRRPSDPGRFGAARRGQRHDRRARISPRHLCGADRAGYHRAVRVLHPGRRGHVERRARRLGGQRSRRAAADLFRHRAATEAVQRPVLPELAADDARCGDGAADRDGNGAAARVLPACRSRRVVPPAAGRGRDRRRADGGGPLGPAQTRRSAYRRLAYRHHGRHRRHSARRAARSIDRAAAGDRHDRHRHHGARAAPPYPRDLQRTDRRRRARHRRLRGGPARGLGAAAPRCQRPR